MNNKTFNTGIVEVQQAITIVPYIFCPLSLISLSFHVILQYCIHKARLMDNQLYLIRLLSITDSLTILFSIPLLAHKIWVETNEHPIIITLSLCVYAFHILSLFVVIFIVNDRWLALKFPLSYYRLVTKRKINIALLAAIIIVVLVLSFCFLINEKDKEWNHFFLYKNNAVLLVLTIFRAVTCVFIIIMGKLTIHIRNQSEENVPNVPNFGREAERFDIIRRLSRSIKDVLKLNIWTCFFLVPMNLTLLVACATHQFSLFFKINALFAFLYLLCNPLVYLTCFTKIRRCWYDRLFRVHRRVNPNIFLDEQNVRGRVAVISLETAPNEDGQNISEDVLDDGSASKIQLRNEMAPKDEINSKIALEDKLISEIDPETLNDLNYEIALEGELNKDIDFEDELNKEIALEDVLNNGIAPQNKLNNEILPKSELNIEITEKME